MNTHIDSHITKVQLFTFMPLTVDFSEKMNRGKLEVVFENFTAYIIAAYKTNIIEDIRSTHSVLELDDNIFPKYEQE